ncbi:hypothetical protein TorRG33x02_048760 [Trema orientale]|uniref:Uncharacterized protein n=1 Tax=Trema orientale TaxID=63057 RepID=A0A2P5FNM3_TREOI|nr:hypothetical protein TorRG33x02_048760 [Trema orientale]
MLSSLSELGYCLDFFDTRKLAPVNPSLSIIRLCDFSYAYIYLYI